ncbi:MAG: alpha/beta hydrolase [bacterium]|nr:alpha/beta hydrolase [bacterium]
MAAVPASLSADCVILLHGLLRTSASMEKAAAAFEARGYTTANIDYPSRDLPVEDLAPLALEAGLAACPDEGTIHFVTHSLGGILVRYYLESRQIPRLGRVVMLAPPNQGSEVVDRLSDVPGFEAMNGPAGLQLGTDEHSVPSRLGPVSYEVGIIAGTETFNPILSQYLPNPDDGKVSVENTKVEGMSDFIVLPHSHPFIMQAPAAIEQAVSFIESGRFVHDAPDEPSEPQR